MRYRVEVADRPDAQYAVWDGRVLQAQRSTADSTILLIAPQDSEASEGFDTEWRGKRAKVVPETEVTSTFSVHTNCRYDDEYFRIAAEPAEGSLTLHWTGQDAAIGAQLGLGDGVLSTDDPERITALWQERHDLPRPADARPEPGSGDSTRLLRAIGRNVLGFLPQGWQRVAAQFRQVGEYAELEVRALGEDDDTGEQVLVSLSPPAELSQLFTLLRSAMYEPGKGTWFQGTFNLDNESNFDFDFDNSAEPGWRLAPGAGGRTAARTYEADLEYFPRDPGAVPEWLTAKAGLPVEVELRHAQVVDSHTAGHPPVVNRPPVPQEETRALLGYLYRAPVVQSRKELRADIFAPNNAPDVPDAFHTDGTWIWPAAVPHYLRKYGLPPEADLLAHIRNVRHHPPYVGPEVRAAAEAELAGNPAPRRTARPSAPDTVTAVRRGEKPPADIRAGEVLAILQQRLAEQGVAESAYRIGDAADGAWCLRKIEQGWELARHEGGSPVRPEYFQHLEPAARALFGTLLLYPGYARAGVPAEAESREPATHATDWPIVPLRGEPPLTFFHGKRVTVLGEGTLLRRFGNEGGNLTHAATTTFPETSLAFEREQEQHTYRVLRALRALTGSTAAFNGLPGGGIAHLLPRAVGHHIETGALERVDQG